MSPELALKPALTEARVSENGYSNETYARFVFWINQTGNSQKRVAGPIGRSAAAINQYIHKKYEGNIPEFEKDIESLLRREEDVEFPFKNPTFRLTSISQRIWTVLQSCDQDRDMGVITGPAGCGKSETLREYKRQVRSSIFITGDVVSRSASSSLGLLGRKLSIGNRGSNSNFLQRITEVLKDSGRLIIVDEAHFFDWGAFEVFRKLHDCAGIGVVFCGQERIYEEMRGGRRSFLWDQIFSRVGVRCHLSTIEKKDIKILTDTICPNLDKPCLEYLLAKATGKGRFRVMMKTLQRAVRIADSEKVPVTLDILKEANSLLLL